MDYRTIVKKLMAQAAEETKQGHDDAAQTFAEKAAALAVRHGVEEALTETFEDEQRPNIILKKIVMGNPFPKHRITLIGVIAKQFSCKVIKSGRNTAEVFGDERDIERVMFLYRLVSTHMLNGVSQARPEIPGTDADKHFYFKTQGLTPGEVKAYRVSWILGYISGINDRMTNAYTVMVEEAKRANPGAALVLADRRSLAEKLVSETYGRLGKVAPSRATNRTGYYAGNAASHKADLGQSAVTIGMRAISA